MEFWDMVLAGALFTGALWYLVRKAMKNRGFCSGCDQGCGCNEPQTEIKKAVGCNNNSKED